MKIPDLCGKGFSFWMAAVTIRQPLRKTVSVLCGAEWTEANSGLVLLPSNSRMPHSSAMMSTASHACLRPVPVSIRDVVDVGCGTDHTIFITREGKGYSTGFGSQGQLGLGFEDDQDVVQEMVGKSLKDRVLTWASAGGQFSAIAATS